MDPIRFPGCPAKHAGGKDLSLWLESYRHWKFWGKTPVELGLMPADRLDPRYYAVMETIAWAEQQYRQPAK